MERTIKFRCWDEELKRMHYDVQNAYDTEVIFHSFNSILESGAPLMQYTGLQDSKGRDIYESDIVKYIWYGWNECSDEEDIKTGIVRFGGTTVSVHPIVGWYIENKHSDTCEIISEPEKHTVEVVGNIYENSNLLN